MSIKLAAIQLDTVPCKVNHNVHCADGSQPEAWQTFERDRPDLIFYQNNRGTVSKDGQPQQQAQRLRTPMVATNRCGFSYHHFQGGVPASSPTTAAWSRRRTRRGGRR